MLFDARAFIAAPGCRSCGNAIGEEAVDHPGQDVWQVLGIVGYGKDLIPVSRICNEGIDARVGINESGSDPQPKFLLPEDVEHLLDRAERISTAGASGAGSERPSRFDSASRNSRSCCVLLLPSRRPR